MMLTPNVFKETQPILVRLYKNGRDFGKAYLTAHEIRDVERTGYEVKKVAGMVR